MAFEDTQTWSRNVEVNGSVRGRLNLTFTFTFSDCNTLLTWGMSAVPTWDTARTYVATGFAPGTPITFPANNTAIKGTLSCSRLSDTRWLVRTDDLEFGVPNTPQESIMGGVVESAPCEQPSQPSKKK